MATPQQIRLDVDRLVGLVEPMGWTVLAQDLRGEEVVISLAKEKSQIGPQSNEQEVGSVAPGEGGGG